MRQVECTINGIGERAGNASLEEIVMALRVPAAIGCRYDTQIKSTALFDDEPAALASSPAEPVQANKAIVGRNAFAHEAGIHQDGVLKDPRTYEIMRPEDVGQSASSRLVLGRHSGRHAVQSRCEALGFTLTAPRKSIRSTTRSSRSASIARRSATATCGASSIASARQRVRAAHLVRVAHVEAVGYGHGV